MSGVSEPRSVRSNFQEATMYNMPLMNRVRLDTMITVVDCSTFLQNLNSGKGATPQDAPELYYRNEGERRDAEEGLTTDLDSGIQNALREIKGMNDDESFDDEHDAGVSDLLIDQTEVADVILLNKVDQVEKNRTMNEIEGIVKALNPKAKVIRTEYGRVNDI